ncbi:MAG: heme ABC exporter ATP-binding protein CcmA [Magnetococcales bacterium]|nr:heme ABC exporter ATP-binding protein CcmA [Magnetococcales bacterium]
MRGVSLTQEKGECLALFGPNGAGKSTLLSVLSTRLRPHGGRFKLGGVNGLDNPELIRARTLFLGHSTGLYGHLTAVENLRFFSDLRGLEISDSTLRKSVTDVGLSRFADRPVGGFSAGMRKRVALGRLLIAQPSLLLLDEPYTALDAQGVDWLNTRIRIYLEGGGSVILVTHDPERVAALPHRQLRLENGTIAS